MEEKQEKEVWTIDELVSMTETVQKAEIEYAGKLIPVQWCELTESEEPKMSMPSDGTPDEEVQEYYKDLAQERVNKMIAKANELDPEGFCIPAEAWNKLPTQARWKITGQILGGDEDTAGNFTSG